uniref:3'-5' exonuclease domain-containing protein n=1 Tax=Macrostomum lignano TaxID=282301 RepID=A0A1I8FI14_9PLAT
RVRHTRNAKPANKAVQHATDLVRTERAVLEAANDGTAWPSRAVGQLVASAHQSSGSADRRSTAKILNIPVQNSPVSSQFRHRCRWIEPRIGRLHRLLCWRPGVHSRGLHFLSLLFSDLTAEVGVNCLERFEKISHVESCLSRRAEQISSNALVLAEPAEEAEAAAAAATVVAVQSSAAASEAVRQAMLAQAGVPPARVPGRLRAPRRRAPFAKAVGGDGGGPPLLAVSCRRGGPPRHPPGPPGRSVARRASASAAAAAPTYLIDLARRPQVLSRGGLARLFQSAEITKVFHYGTNDAAELSDTFALSRVAPSLRRRSGEAAAGHAYWQRRPLTLDMATEAAAAARAVLTVYGIGCRLEPLGPPMADLSDLQAAATRRDEASTKSKKKLAGKAMKQQMAEPTPPLLLQLMAAECGGAAAVAADCQPERP